MITKSISCQRDLNYYINPYINLKAYETNGPQIIEKGKGVFVYDENGKECLGSGVSPWDLVKKD